MFRIRGLAVVAFVTSWATPVIAQTRPVTVVGTWLLESIVDSVCRRLERDADGRRRSVPRGLVDVCSLDAEMISGAGAIRIRFVTPDVALIDLPSRSVGGQDAAGQPLTPSELT